MMSSQGRIRRKGGAIPIRIQPKDRSTLVEAALGTRSCDQVIDHAQIVNLFTGEIYPGSVGILDGLIAHVQGDPDGLQRPEKALTGKVHYDAGGQYLIPGLIDAHVHIESSMMTPGRFTEAVLPHGTTTVITDPHEIANVQGIDGVRYMHDASRDLPMRHLILAPSCVPSVPGKEQSGAVFTGADIRSLMELERVMGLAEVMDYPGVLRNDPRLQEMLDLACDEGWFVQGHAPFLTGRDLSAYRVAGPLTDHESRTAQEARDKFRVGMVVDARDSSTSQNVGTVIQGVKGFRYLDHLTLCTDDREPEDILQRGHMNDVVRSAVQHGLDPVDAIRCATLHTAKALGLNRLGAVAPGYTADLVLTPDLADIRPSAVFFGGNRVAVAGELVAPIPMQRHPFEERNTVFLPEISEDLFRINAPVSAGTVRTRIIAYRDFTSSTTDFVEEDLPVKDGCLDLSQRPDLKFAVVLNRHRGNTNMGYGVVRNLGIRHGAVASTVAHDCHNLVVIYDTPENAALAAADIVAMKGGISCAANGKICESLPLPVGGLMSTQPARALADAAARMKETLRSLGLESMKNPLLRVAFFTLAVIPYAKMTDLGMLDVERQEMTSLFEE